MEFKLKKMPVTFSQLLEICNCQQHIMYYIKAAFIEEGENNAETN